MEISKEQLMRIIAEECQSLLEDDQQAFGKGTMSRGDAAKTLRQKATDVTGQEGVDAKERAIIAQVEKLLATLANKGDLKKGNSFVSLRKIYGVLQKELESIVKRQQK